MTQALVPGRRCPRCGVYKPADPAHFLLGARGALATHCLACTQHQQRAPILSGHRHIDRGVYDDLFARQGGCCGACGRPERLLDAAGQPERLEFYAHSNGARALICFTCDLACTGVGHDPTRAAQLAVFLGGAPPVLTQFRVHLEEPPPAARPAPDDPDASES